ncbi:methyltransferase domain-containing protein [Aliikangiella maris]|uniref:Class I SAM-dependent methyltransferase n=2 Tax=Aliikangiella maris TaxID=3162458 RepID=A0ABV3MUC5_9GAMM
MTVNKQYSDLLNNLSKNNWFADNQFQQVRSLIQCGNITQAKSYLKKLSTNQQSLPANIFLKALLDYSSQQYLRAIGQLESLIQVDPDNCEIRAILADSFRKAGLYDKAIPHYNILLNHQYNEQQVKVNLFNCLFYAKPLKYSLSLEQDALCYFTFEGVNHHDLCGFVSELIQLKYALKDGNETLSLIQIAKDNLLKKALIQINLTNEYLEMFLTGIRFTLLKEILTNDNIDIQLIDLAICLAIQLFNNEYIYQTDPEEDRLVNELITILNNTLINNSSIINSASFDSTQLMNNIMLPLIVLAMYRPLHLLQSASQLLEIPDERWPPMLKLLVSQQLINPFEEQQLRNTIKSIDTGETRIPNERNLSRSSSIDTTSFDQIAIDQISAMVKDQYEANPYPRWQTASVNQSASYAEFIRQQIPEFIAPAYFAQSELRMLIAGCGTGKQVVELAKTYPTYKILAIDLSLASLSFAKRKALEYGITNVEFMQADILNLSSLNLKFAIIECIGVLHHMQSPLEGWKQLKKLLLPGGIMKIALYSKLARKSINQVRAIMRRSNKHVETNDPLFIKQFRQSVMLGEYGDTVKNLALGSRDFFSISGCRDLFLHTHEIQFDCLEIANHLEELELKFLGFCYLPADIFFSYSKIQKSSKNSKLRLDNLYIWHKAEQKHPEAFSRMYQFWCQSL